MNYIFKKTPDTSAEDSSDEEGSPVELSDISMYDYEPEDDDG